MGVAATFLSAYLVRRFGILKVDSFFFFLVGHLEFLVLVAMLIGILLFVLPGWSSGTDISGFSSYHGGCCILEWTFIPPKSSFILLMLNCENHFLVFYPYS